MHRMMRSVLSELKVTIIILFTKTFLALKIIESNLERILLLIILIVREYIFEDFFVAGEDGQVWLHASG